MDLGNSSIRMVGDMKAFGGRGEWRDQGSCIINQIVWPTKVNGSMISFQGEELSTISIHNLWPFPSITVTLTTSKSTG